MTTGEHSFCFKFSASTAINSTVLTTVYSTESIAVSTMESREL